MLPMYESTTPAPHYISFLVRLWRESDDEGDWIAQVEHIVSGESKYFSSLDDMFAYLRVRYSKDGMGKDGMGAVEQPDYE